MSGLVLKSWRDPGVQETVIRAENGQEIVIRDDDFETASYITKEVLQANRLWHEERKGCGCADCLAELEEVLR